MAYMLMLINAVLLLFNIGQLAALSLNLATSIKEIAYQLGFEDEFYFSNLFKSRYQLSPKNYRLSQNANEKWLSVFKFGQYSELYGGNQVLQLKIPIKAQAVKRYVDKSDF